VGSSLHVDFLVSLLYAALDHPELEGQAVPLNSHLRRVLRHGEARNATLQLLEFLLNPISLDVHVDILLSTQVGIP